MHGRDVEGTYFQVYDLELAEEVLSYYSVDRDSDNKKGACIMKIKNITDIDGFFKVIDSCQGKVELITGEGDRLNLKSKLCQYVSLTSILKTDVEIPELELVAYEPEDTEKIIKFLMKG